MRITKKAVLIGLSYLIAFVAAVGISGFIINGGKSVGEMQERTATLPVVYVRTSGQLMNEMHGYVTAVDGGYYRDTLTAVGDSKTINLSLYEYGYEIVSGSYELYNDQYDTLIESGDCTKPEAVSGMLQMQMVFKSTLTSNCEYCLRIMLEDADGQIINYYTRVRYGADLKVSEKLQFVLDFNEATFDKSSVTELSNYLETSTTGNSNYSQVTIESTSSEVTWGNLSPVRTSDIAIRLKEINTETAAFTLSYTVYSAAGDTKTYYEVEEYYRIRWSSDQIYLLDFERTMHEDMSLTELSIVNGSLRLGIGDSSDIAYGTYGTDDQTYVYVQTDDKLWLLDTNARLLTLVYDDSVDGHSCSQQDELAIKVVYTDDNNGDLYFLVYGYMHGGNYEGQEGVLVCYYSQENVLLEEMMFIPTDKGFQQLEESILQLSYMNEKGELYLMLEDSIYLLNPTLGRMSVAWTGLSSESCAASSDGILVIAEGSSDYGGSYLRIVNLNTDKETILQEDGYYVKPLGFVEGDFVYGLVDVSLITADSNGVIQAPMSMLRILDSDLNEVKTYEKSGCYVSSISISGGTVTINLEQAVANGEYTDYEVVETEYLIHNSGTENSGVYLSTAKDSVLGVQNWLKLGISDSYVPIAQSARYLDPGYDITKEYTGTEEVELYYYVYTKGHLAASFTTIQEAIDYGNTYAGTVMTSHKQVLWQRAGRANIWDLSVSSIGKTEEDSLNAVLLEVIADYEGWELSEDIDASLSLLEAMTEYLPVEVIDLTGVAMTDVLHFVYRDRLVAGKISDDVYALIIAYDSSRVKLANPESGRTYWISWSYARQLFSENGNVFYSYID